ncbi:MAG: hypothetical protein A2189_06570 [Paenibacillus sp. RIFOXYA1_FULL_44_5]|nr:MAG: hypothetical protein A2189_06570 [Paenibacillus sp. RIFOXYA1_FULL_44_5]
MFVALVWKGVQEKVDPSGCRLVRFFCFAFTKPAKVQVFSFKTVCWEQMPAIMQEFQAISF